jgi:anti-sigma B factor antagonist
MTYTIHQHQTIQVVKVEDLYSEISNNEILSDVQSYIEKGFNKFVIDLSDLRFMNSVGLNFLLSMMKNSEKSGGELAVANANEQILGLLEITKLKQLFNLKPSVETALQEFTSN